MQCARQDIVQNKRNASTVIQPRTLAPRAEVARRGREDGGAEFEAHAERPQVSIGLLVKALPREQQREIVLCDGAASNHGGQLGAASPARHVCCSCTRRDDVSELPFVRSLAVFPVRRVVGVGHSAPFHGEDARLNAHKEDTIHRVPPRGGLYSFHQRRERRLLLASKQQLCRGRRCPTAMSMPSGGRLIRWLGEHRPCARGLWPRTRLLMRMRIHVNGRASSTCRRRST
eukprot:scaffold13160_cov106-Isochrysis_galbana.AAC.11